MKKMERILRVIMLLYLSNKYEKRSDVVLTNRQFVSSNQRNGCLKKREEDNACSISCF